MNLTLQHSLEGFTYFAAPRSLDVTYFTKRWPAVAITRFDDAVFSSRESYNAWMLQPDLCREFAVYDFILLAQTDAFLIRPLPTDLEWRFDYLGAPWGPALNFGWDRRVRRLYKPRRIFGRQLAGKRLRVGNGGLSLRRTQAFSEVLNLPTFSIIPNEDIAISYFSRRIGVKLAAPQIAQRFFMELGAKPWRTGDPIPDVVGFHALDKFNPALEDLLLYGSDAPKFDDEASTNG